ncbi:MAG TPA: polyphosphate polymerase domain-containing protein [Verrucomicrobiae bacterium]|nr:polyphosphate polymerase domain-containing protein [Verrucomicrobiae bacterium]
MRRDRMQQSRFELKYLIKEQTAEKVRDFVRCYLAIDEYGVGKPNYSYPVHSLYLDSDNLEIYWRTVNGDKNRYKLRLRYYSDHPDTPVFFEIKRRMKDVILKQRGGVKHEAVPLLLSGHLPGDEHMISRNPTSLVAVQRFCQLMLELRAKPKSHIYYKREAYVSDNDDVRVTMDRDVYSEPNLDSTIKTKMTKPVHSYAGFVILELKFTNRFPNWFRELVRMANSMQCGAAKYLSGVQLMGHNRLHAHAEVLEEESLLSTLRPGDDLPAFVREDKSLYLLVSGK